MSKRLGKIGLNDYGVFVLGNDAESKAIADAIWNIKVPPAPQTRAGKVTVFVDNVATHPDPNNTEFIEEGIAFGKDGRLTIRDKDILDKIKKHNPAVRLHFRIGDACWVLKYPTASRANTMCGCDFEP
jgi:hypothetical protein